MSRIKIVSGGQTGVDIAALRAAKQLGIATGGWMPLGWLTEDGPRPDFAELYGMLECQTPGYPARTRANVRDSDVTLWYGPTGSYGSRATLAACNKLGKYDALVDSTDYDSAAETACELRHLWSDNSMILNCAGNRESGNPGIGTKAEAYFLRLFAELLNRTK